LPALGLITGLTYWYFDKRVPNTTKLLHQAHETESKIPFLTGLLIFVFTILSQIFGASTGRESTAVQFGAALAEFWKDIFLKFKWTSYFHRQAYVRCGLAAGFGAVFGVPWAGAVFALEVVPFRRWPFRYLPLVMIASFGAHGVAKYLGAIHKVYPQLMKLSWNFPLVLKWLCLGVAFGLMAKLFIVLQKILENYFFRTFFPMWLRPAIGGLAVALMTLSFHHTRFNGMGLPLIEAAFTTGSHTFDFAWKSLFTVVSTASGLKGGEVTPLMAIGASLGSVLAGWLTLPMVYAASLGLIGVFAGSAHLPWTGAIMAWEFFGFEAFLPAFFVCWIARRFVGVDGLYVVNE
jgi:H+/Cl- antiporter ClcA